MPTDAFNKACDRLASELDPSGHEYRRWAKDERAKLEKVAELIQQTFANRDDFQIQPALGTRDARSFLLTLGETNAVAQLTAKLSGDGISIWAVEVGGGGATVSPQTNVPDPVPLDDITLETVTDALAAALNRIRV